MNADMINPLRCYPQKVQSKTVKNEAFSVNSVSSAAFDSPSAFIGVHRRRIGKLIEVISKFATADERR
jgi:hypothetical protein